MAFARTRSVRTGLVLALLLSVGILLGLSPVTHSHDGGFSLSHCEACRWASDATPILAMVLVLFLMLPESGPAHAPAPVLRAQQTRRRARTRGPPLV